MRTVIAWGALFALVTAVASAAWADADASSNGLEGLAPPGPCAEERDTLRGEPEDGVETAPVDLAGAPRVHFAGAGADVAAGVPGAGGLAADGFRPPEAPTVLRGPCEGPAAGCADVFAPRGQGGVIVEPAPGAGSGPVFGGRGGAGSGPIPGADQ